MAEGPERLGGKKMRGGEVPSKSALRLMGKLSAKDKKDEKKKVKKVGKRMQGLGHSLKMTIVPPAI